MVDAPDIFSEEGLNNLRDQVRNREALLNTAATQLVDEVITPMFSGEEPPVTLEVATAAIDFKIRFRRNFPHDYAQEFSLLQQATRILAERADTERRQNLETHSYSNNPNEVLFTRFYNFYFENWQDLYGI